MANFIQTDPVRYYQVNGDNCKLLQANIALAPGNNQQLVAAISGQIIRVLGWIAQGPAAGFPSFSLKSNSGGTVLTPHFFVPNNAAGLTEKLPINNSGYFETTVSQGLFADINVANLNMLIFYIVYTP